MRLTVDLNVRKETISKHIYGHFAEHLGRCIYGGIWVGEDSSIPNTEGLRNDVVDVLRKMGIPNLRWPGGCFADAYHWKDGVGKRESRPSMVNTHWGGVTENNHFGTHEFMRLCELIGAEPYICGNLGSGTVQEMRDWIDYMTTAGKSPMADLRRGNGQEDPWRLVYFGVGNENWGCGGSMTAEFYSEQYRRYATYVRNVNREIVRIAGGANVDDYHWTEVMMREAARWMEGISVHYYTRVSKDWSQKGSATDFDESEWFSVLGNALFMDELIKKHSAIMDRYDPDKRIALVVDEWGTWYQVEPGTNPRFLYQQNTMRDALVAGLHLNIFNNHCDRVRMANLAQTINVLQSVILTEAEKMLLTPTYHVFEMFQVHQGATLLPVLLDHGVYEFEEKKLPQISVSASLNNQDEIHLSLCNLDPTRPAEIDALLRGGSGRVVSGSVLTATTMQAHNTFAQPDLVKPLPLEGARMSGENLTVTLPPMSVSVLRVVATG